jgi:mutator protein MutT
MSFSNPLPIGACAILINPTGQVLLGKRKNSYKAGYYGFPGGRVDVNETLKTAIQREVLEETGLSLTNLEYLGVVRENQGEYDFIHFIYVARNVTATPQLIEPEKCEGWEWLDSATLDTKMILPGHAAAIQLLENRQQLADLTTS